MKNLVRFIKYYKMMINGGDCYKKVVLSFLTIFVLAGLLASTLALAEEEKVKVNLNEVHDSCWSKLTPTQLTQQKVTVPESWVEGCFKKNEVKKVSTSTGRKYSWGVHKIKAPEALSVLKKIYGEEIPSEKTIAVIDSGVSFSNQLLQNRRWENKDEQAEDGVDNDHNGFVDDRYGWNFYEDKAPSPTGTNSYFHGSFVSGVLTEFVPRAQIMSLKVTDDEGNFERDEVVARAITYAVKNGCDIINLSISFDSEPSALTEQAIEKAYNKGIPIIGGVGNKSSEVQWPGRYDEVFATTAIDEGNRLYSKANTGSSVFISASGVSVDSIDSSGEEVTASGTSFSAPYVSGVVALMLSANPELKVFEIRDILAMTASDLGPPGLDKKFGWGLVDAESAVRKALELKEKEDG